MPTPAEFWGVTALLLCCEMQKEGPLEIGLRGSSHSSLHDSALSVLDICLQRNGNSRTNLCTCCKQSSLNQGHRDLQQESKKVYLHQWIDHSGGSRVDKNGWSHLTLVRGPKVFRRIFVLAHQCSLSAIQQGIIRLTGKEGGLGSSLLPGILWYK